MIDQIFDLIMKEARSRKGETLELRTLLVLLEVQEKVCGAIKTMRSDKTKAAHLN